MLTQLLSVVVVVIVDPGWVVVVCGRCSTEFRCCSSCVCRSMSVVAAVAAVVALWLCEVGC